jgi:hypothetical protein
MSRADRPVGTMPAGWISERVNTSDWCEPVGEIFNGSCWCEVSLLLGYADVPGVYARSDTRFVFSLEAVEASWTDSGRLRLCNPTRWPARVKVLVENRSQSGMPLPVNLGPRLTVVELNAGGTRDIDMES